MEEIEVKKEFIPKPIQVKFATLYMQIPRKTQAEIAQEIRINRRTIYNWLKNSDFRSWLNTQCNTMIQKCLVELYQVGLVQALRGKFDFWKVIMELAGVYTPGMKIDTGDQEQIRIEIVQSQAQAQTQPQDSTIALKQPENTPEGSTVDE